MGHQRQGVGERRLRVDGDRIDHHAGFELLDLTDRLGLLVRRQVAVDDADAAGLRHGDGEPRLGDRVHGRRQDRQVEADRAGQPRADIGLGRKDRGIARRQQDVVEGERLAAGLGFDDHGHGAHSRI